ncbi:hypothetical protein [Rhodococcus sp. 27YEA15]
MGDDRYKNGSELDRSLLDVGRRYLDTSGRLRATCSVREAVLLR